MSIFCVPKLSAENHHGGMRLKAWVEIREQFYETFSSQRPLRLALAVQGLHTYSVYMYSIDVPAAQIVAIDNVQGTLQIYLKLKSTKITQSANLLYTSITDSAIRSYKFVTERIYYYFNFV